MGVRVGEGGRGCRRFCKALQQAHTALLPARYNHVTHAAYLHRRHEPSYMMHGVAVRAVLVAGAVQRQVACGGPE